MANTNHLLDAHEVARAREVYCGVVDLVDEQLEVFDPERDKMPVSLALMLGPASLINNVTVRYHVVEPPVVRNSPYDHMLESAPIIAFQRLDRDLLSLPSHRKIEFFDPCSRLGGVSLMMVTLEDEDRFSPDLPLASVTGETIDPLYNAPLYNPPLTEHLSGLTETLKQLAIEEKIEPISYVELQL